MNKFMELAIETAQKANIDIPVGAVIVKNGEVISFGVNQKEQDNDITSHAEILAIRGASKKLHNWRLDNCQMYVTLEPCPMCCWAIIQSRIDTLYFGSYDKVYGGFFSKYDLRNFTNSNLKVYGGICENECNELLEKFFSDIRK